MNELRRWVVAAGILAPVVFLMGQEAKKREAGKPDEPRLGIRFRGFLPGSQNPTLEGTYEVEFRIYRSPQGGEPIWRETAAVPVREGRMDVVLGKRVPIPMEIHEATFKFLGASVGGNREVYPRFAIVNVVYASRKEALVALAGGAGASERRSGTEKPSAYGPREAKVGKEEKKATWREALAAARAAGGDLPDYEDWYQALENLAPDAVEGWTGHYEWVLPWVYDTASHGRLNLYFRGRFEGCDYMDLSPANKYAYRIALSAGKGGEAAKSKRKVGTKDE